MPRQFRTNFTILLLSSILVAFTRLLTADESSSSPPPSTTQPAYRTVQQLQSNLTSTPQESVVLCADGKGPLLEGEERIFPCAGQCPAGFECEYVRPRASEGGICCPNLSELYRLYNEESNGGEEGGGEVLDDGQQPDKDGKDQQELGVNAMALLEQHLGKSVVRPRPKVRSVPPDAAAALVSSRPVEIRRSQQRWQQSLSEANIWRPKAQAARPVIGQKDASGEEYSCRRQRLELFCEDGRRHTQFVVRWFAKEGRCLSYPWGYCPGEPVASDRTLRTREECELLCIDPLDAGQDQPVLSVVRFGIGDDKPQQQQQQRELQKPSESFSRQPQLLTQQAEKGRKEEWESPLAIVGGAPNQEVDPQQHQELAAVEAEPEPIDLSAAQPPGGQSQSESSPPSSASAELADFLLVDQRPQPRRKRCEKVTPYRAMCPRDGMPSQFTLRWYQRGQACFAYPYGYCHGESVYEEEPIKTERECLAICVQRRGAVPRRLMAAKSRRRS